MPIYEYKCSACNEEFAALQGINAKTEDTRCPKCGSLRVQKKMSAFSCCSLGSSASGAKVGFPTAGFSGG